jgi:hypothetical protein
MKLIIEDKKFLVIGGARSIDKKFRKLGISWWEEEEPTYADYYKTLHSIEEHKNEVDYVISHTAPTSAIKQMFGFSEKYFDPTTVMLENIQERTKFKQWFFGHFHENKTFEKFTCLFEKGFIIA